jgi:hypothetical protein
MPQEDKRMCRMGVSGIASVFLATAMCSSGFAQFGGGGTGTTGGGIGTGGQLQQAGMQQTGQLSSSAAIQRNGSNFLSGVSAGSFLSSSGTAGGGAGGGQTGLLSGLTGGAGGLGGVAGFGLGLGIGGGLGRGAGGLGGFGNQAFQNQNQTGATQLRIPMRVDFPRPVLSPTALSVGIESRLVRLPGLQSVAPRVDVRIDGQTAVLEGVVPGQHEKDLIGRLMMLEPGIATVQNNLLIEPGTRLAPPPPAR